MKSIIIAFSCLCASACAGFRPGELWPDNNGAHINAHGGGVMFHDGRYYWFGEHKIAGKAGNAAHVGVHVYSSPDLHHWKDEGIALRVSDDPASEIAKGCILERPKVIHNEMTGKFVMWFHLEPAGMGYLAARSGVAVADRAIGPYRYLGSMRPNAGVWPANAPDELRKPLTRQEADALAGMRLPGNAVRDYPENLLFRRDHAGGQMARDMNLFVDDDRKAYHIYSSEENGTLHISELTGDYLKPAGRYVRIFPGGFNEAPALFKHRGRYFLISSGCTGWSPNAARLASADTITGPWTHLGNPCVGPAESVKTTFNSQSTCVFQVHGKPSAFIFMADRWRPDDAIDGRYVWLPVQFDRDGRPFLKWLDRWDLDFFKP